MNIAFVNSTFGWGGVKTWYLQFAERLAKRGNHVFVYGRQPEFIDAARKTKNINLSQKPMMEEVERRINEVIDRARI